MIQINVPPFSYAVCLIYLPFLMTDIAYNATSIQNVDIL